MKKEIRASHTQLERALARLEGELRAAWGEVLHRQVELEKRVHRLESKVCEE